MITKSQKLLLSLIKQNSGIEDKTKLAKLQYFADFIHYAFHNTPISNPDIIYTKQKQGPLSRSFTDDLEDLKKVGLIIEKPKFHYHLAKDIDIDLSAIEKKTIEFVIGKYGNSSYKELVDICHSQAPFLSSGKDEIVEFFTSYNLVDEYPEYASSSI